MVEGGVIDRGLPRRWGVWVRGPGLASGFGVRRPLPGRFGFGEKDGSIRPARWNGGAASIVRSFEKIVAKSR